MYISYSNNNSLQYDNELYYLFARAITIIVKSFANKNNNIVIK